MTVSEVGLGGVHEIVSPDAAPALRSMATAAGSKIFQNIPVPILFILISCLVSFGKASKPAEMSSRAAFIHSNQTFGVGCSRQSHSTRFKIPAFSDFRQFADEPLQLVKPDLNHKRLVLVKENIKVRSLHFEASASFIPCSTADDDKSLRKFEESLPRVSSTKEDHRIEALCEELKTSECGKLTKKNKKKVTMWRVLLLYGGSSTIRFMLRVGSSSQVVSKIEGPVATIAVVGKFHSGKSFLMNQLMGKTKGFGIGPTVRPETMGIWMWGQVLMMS